MGNWQNVTKLEVGSSWVWSPPLLGNWFFIDVSTDAAIEVGQGDGEYLVGDANLLDGRRQSFYLPNPEVLDVADRRLAFRTAETVKFQVGTIVTISSITISSLPSGTDPAIAASLTALQTQQAGILQILQNPIQAQIDPALAANIQTLIMAQAEILALVQEPTPTDPVIVSSLESLLAGQSQILQQFPVTVSPDSVLRGKVQTILNLLQPPPIADLVAISASYTITQSSAYNSLTIGTAANLTDSNGATGAGTNAGSLEWVQATFDVAVEVGGIRVGGGNMSGWGSVAPYLNNKQIQWSVDGLNWGVLATIIKVEDSGPNQFVLFAFPKVSARFFRVAGNGFLATTEFKLFN